MTEISAKRILRKELTPEQKLTREFSYIYFYPEHTTGIEAIKNGFADLDKNELYNLIPEIVTYSQTEGPTKYKFMENPAGIPIIFMANKFFVGNDEDGNKIYDLNVEIGKPRHRSQKNVSASNNNEDEKKMLAMAKRIPFFKTTMKRKAV